MSIHLTQDGIPVGPDKGAERLTCPACRGRIFLLRPADDDRWTWAQCAGCYASYGIVESVTYRTVAPMAGASA